MKSQGEEVMRRQLLFLIHGPEKVPGKQARSKSGRMTDRANVVSFYERCERGGKDQKWEGQI